MPVWYVFVCDPRRDVEHDDTALTLDVIAIPEATKLLLTSGIPDVEADGSKVGREFERVDFDAESSCKSNPSS